MSPDTVVRYECSNRKVCIFEATIKKLNTFIDDGAFLIKTDTHAQSFGLSPSVIRLSIITFIEILFIYVIWYAYYSVHTTQVCYGPDWTCTSCPNWGSFSSWALRKIGGLLNPTHITVDRCLSNSYQTFLCSHRVKIFTNQNKWETSKLLAYLERYVFSMINVLQVQRDLDVESSSMRLIAVWLQHNFLNSPVIIYFMPL